MSSSSSQRYRHPTSYTLYVEHLGTIIPILEATKRNYKIRQAFTISLPSSSGANTSSLNTQKSSSDVSESELLFDNSEGTVATNLSHLRLLGHEAHLSLNTELGVQLACREDDSDSPRHPIVATNNVLPVGGCTDGLHKNASFPPDFSRHLAEVTSNVMASKFKIQGLSDQVAVDMGSIMIKTSFLHIQPRKVIAYLPYPESTPDSGIDTDTSSDESMEEGGNSTEVDTSCSADVFMEPESHSIESLMSMEELLMPKTIEPETQAALVETSSEHKNVKPVSANSTSGSSGCGTYSCTSTNVKGQRVSVSESHIQIHSKTPTWNEQHMIYQLDFGGRVTTKSAKNFQLEMDNEQVGLWEGLSGIGGRIVGGIVFLFVDVLWSTAHWCPSIVDFGECDARTITQTHQTPHTSNTPLGRFGDKIVFLFYCCLVVNCTGALQLLILVNVMHAG